MNQLEHLLLPITYNNGNTYSYSSRLNTLISLSNDVGAMPEPLSLSPNPPSYLFDADRNPIDHYDLLSMCKEIDGSDDLESDLIAMLEDKYDVEGEPILETNFKYTLPYAFKYSKARETSIVQFSPHLLDDQWMGLLEYKTSNKFDTDITPITYKSNIADIDLLLNEKLDQHIDLIGSDNYLYTIVEEIAGRRNEKINIDDAVDYFLGKPFRMLLLANAQGIAYIMENGHEEYCSQLYRQYTVDIGKKDEVLHPNMTRLFHHDFINKSSIAYENFCCRLDIQPNWILFEKWHNYHFRDCETVLDSVVNSIVRISTGYDFTVSNWGYFQKAVFQLAQQDRNENSSTVFKEWLNNRR